MSGRCTTSPPAARWPTCSSGGSASLPACGRRSPARSSGGTARASRAHAEGEAIPLAMRVVHLSHDMEAIGRLFSPDRARRGRARPPRPHVRPGARRPVRRARGDWFDRLARGRAVGRGPRARARAAPDAGRRALDDALVVAADFIDLKSPYMGGHSRRCAQLATDAARVLGLPEDVGHGAPPGGARARLRHHRGAELDLGQAGPAHPDGVRPRRAPPDADRADAAPLAGPVGLNPVASTHHEKCDGSGYHRRVTGRHGRSVGLPAGRHRDLRGAHHRRADRPPFSDADAAAELRRLDAAGRARAPRDPRRARGRRPRRAGGAHAPPAGEPGRAVPSRGRRAPPRGARAHDAPDRRSARHLTEDRRPPHPAHLRARSASRPAPRPRSGRCSTRRPLRQARSARAST